MRVAVVADYPGYSVSDDGRVFSDLKGELVSRPGKDGYLRVKIYRHGIPHRYDVQVHRLVAIAFVGEPPYEEAVVRHRNHVRTDNRAENLVYGSIHDNVMDTVLADRHSRGERHGCSKLKDADASAIRIRHARGDHYLALAAEYGVSFGQILKIARGKAFKHVTTPPSTRRSNGLRVWVAS